MILALAGPSPKTVWVAFLNSGQAAQSAAALRRSEILGFDGISGSAVGTDRLAILLMMPADPVRFLGSLKRLPFHWPAHRHSEEPRQRGDEESAVSAKKNKADSSAINRPRNDIGCADFA